MQICVRDHVEVRPQIKKKEVLYFVKKTWEKQESRVISCHLKCMYMALQRTDQKYILSFHNTDSPQCIARTRFYHLYKRGEGHFRPRSRGGLANFTPIAGMGHLISEPKFKIPTHPPPSPLLISDKSLSRSSESKLPQRSLASVICIVLIRRHPAWFRLKIKARARFTQGRTQEFFQEGVHSSLALLQHQ